jgi:hypothetical protein
MSNEIEINSAAFRAARNKGRLVGQKRPLRPKEVWAVRVRLQIRADPPRFAATKATDAPESGRGPDGHDAPQGTWRESFGSRLLPLRVQSIQVLRLADST